MTEKRVSLPASTDHGFLLAEAIAAKDEDETTSLVVVGRSDESD